ncbi:MAG: hypothetical protein DRN57_06780 [Thermoplasmata archaeon]|nr:MAG: hypothetical protein DRN57_06780 [Thermoplasmata archaeon]
MIDLTSKLILSIKVLYTNVENLYDGDLMDATYRLRMFRDQAKRFHQIYLERTNLPRKKDES